MDTFTLRQNIADYICQHFFDGKRGLKGKIIKDLVKLDSDTLMDYNLTLKNQEDYILDALHKMDAKSSFKFPYGRFRYLQGMVERLIKEANIEAADSAYKPRQKVEPPDQPPNVDNPGKKLTYAQRQNIKNFPDGDIPVITEADLF